MISLILLLLIIIIVYVNKLYLLINQYYYNEYEASVGHLVDWTVVRGHASKFTRAGHSAAGAFDHAEDSQVDNAAPRGAGAHSPLERTG